MVGKEIGFEQVCQLVGGLALFLYGIELASHDLRKIAGGKIKTILNMLTGNSLLGVSAGVLVTAAVQSSSASTVILVGLADVGLLNLVQAITVTLGASIGTTITVQLLAFDFVRYAWLTLFAGYLTRLFSKHDHGKILGQALIGFSLVFIGMWVMKLAFTPIVHLPYIQTLFASFNEYPAYGVMIAFLVSAIIHSAATVGIMLAIIQGGGEVGLAGSLAVIVGASVGTCTAALLASIGASRKGKQVAVAHFLFKLLGALITIPFIVPLADLIAQMNSRFGIASPARALANADTVYSIALAVFFLPFIGLLAFITKKIIPLEKQAPEARLQYLSESDLASPVLALLKTRRELERMGKHCLSMMSATMRLLETGDTRIPLLIKKTDDLIDALYASLTAFLTRLGTTGSNREETAMRDAALVVARNLEYVGDILSKDLLHLAGKKSEEDIDFTMEGMADLRETWLKVQGNLEMVVSALASDNFASLSSVVAYERELEAGLREMTLAHFSRMEEGLDTASQSTPIFLETLSQLKILQLQLVEIAEELLRLPKIK